MKGCIYLINVLKKVSLFLVVFLLLSMSIYSFATESKVETICNLTFKVNTDKDFTGNIAVIMKDIATNKEYQFLLQSNKGYSANDKFGIVANTTYNVSVSYPNSDKFKLFNADGTEIKSYHATESGLNLLWEMKAISKDTATITQKSGDKPKVNFTANEMVNKFVEKTKFIEFESGYKNFINLWSGAVYKELYLTEKGSTEKSWNTMSKYQQACYTLLFLYPKTFILGTNSNIYATDRNTFIKNLDVPNMLLKNLSKGDAVYTALIEAWDWHWNNWSTKRLFINPFEGVKYDETDKKESLNDFELTPQDKKEIQKDIANTKEVVKGEEKRKNLASPNNFLDILKKNIVTLLILIIIGIAFLVVFLKNKKKNHINDD